ncbi:single-stranded DNA-binding protein [Nocardioides caricicola]|uniref:Single-stranded DNA-binding protein n=1 Tax=Nocardioides caricicola TaxID=634770 RepID=A0ABW0N6A4_9ACTN
MNDTTITLQGWLGSDVELRRAGDVPVASFRLACTPRRFNRRTENWSDGVTQWYTVSAWRALGENAATSLRRGDPVVVTGRLHVRTYVNKEDVEVVVFEVDATHLGHDLSRGTSAFTRTPKQEQAGQEQAEAAA